MFGHPSQHEHMHAGIKAAIDSPNTPAHLKEHLQKRLGGSPMKPMIGAMPKKNNKVKVGKTAKKMQPKKVAAVNNAKPLLPAEFYGAK